MADRSQNETEDPTRKEEEGKKYPEEEGGDDESQRGVDRRRKKDDCSDEEEEEESTNVSDRHEVTSNGDKGTKSRQQQLTGGGGEEREGESVDGNHDDDEGENREGQEDIELKLDSDHSHEEEEKKEYEKKEEEEEEEKGEEEEEEEEEKGEEEEEEEGEEGEEKEDAEVLTKDNPMFVPRAGPYFYHDSRFDDETGEADQPTTETMSTVTKLKCQELDKWEHDLYVAEEQKPREEWEKKKDREYYENLERRRNRQRDGVGADRRDRGRGSKLGDFMPSQERRGGASNYREQHQNRRDWRSESGRYHEKEYRDKGRERRDGQYHQERNNERRGSRRDFRQYNQERERGREGNRERRDFNERRENWEGTNQTIPQEEEQEREKESWENNGENWEQDLETQEMNRKTTNKGEERQSGFKNERRSNQRDEYNQGRRPQGGWSSERNEERHQQGRQRNNGGRLDGRRENSGRGRYDNDWQHSEGNIPTSREEEVQVKNEDSIKKDDSVNDSTATNQERGESQSLFSFSSSRVFSLSVNDRLVVREVDHSKTSGRRIGRGRGRGRGITSGSKDVGIVGKTQSVSTNEEPPVTNNTVTSGTDPPPPDSDITSDEANVKPAQDGPSNVPEGQDTVAGDPMESNEVESKGEPPKPKRYSSRRQKPDQPEGTDSADKTISSGTGLEYPPPPFGYGWVYPQHPSMIPHQVDPNSYQAQQQQLHFYQQHMRLLQDMYSQHTGGATGANPPLIPLLPHLMTPQDQFTLLPPGSHFPSLTPPPPRYPLSSGDLKPSPTVDISHESSPSPAVGAPAPTEKKPSQAIPIVAPADTQ